MSNVLTLMRNDMRRLFKNVVSTIIVIGLVVMPSIFAWYNILACWDVFNNTGNLKVAVASNDAGYQSDLVPLKVNVGEQVISALRANDEIDWVFTDSDDAIDGANSGRYYAAVVIPEGFSQDMLTFYSGDSHHARIVYYSNEKKSAIAPKITDKGADSVSYQVNKVFAETLAEIALSIAQAFSNYADDAGLGAQVAGLAQHMRDVAGAVEDAAGVVGSYARLMDSTQVLIGQTADLAASAQARIDGSSAAGNLAAARDRLHEAMRAMEDGIAALEGAGSVDADGASGSLADEAQQAIDELKGKYANEFKPALDALAASVDDAIALVKTDVGALRGAGDDLFAAARAIELRFSSASGKLTGVEDNLRSTSSSLVNVADRIDAALQNNDMDELRQIIGSDAETLASAVSAPVEVERIAVFPSETFGSSMTPLYTTLALFIGSLLIMVTLKPTVGPEARASLSDPKPWQLFIGRFGAVAFISLLQTTVMGLGNIFFLQVQATHPWLLMACFWIAGLVFSFIIYALVAAFANLGKAIAVLMLIIQVTGCGGSFPLQVLPDFVQALSPWLPATHVVNAMRAAMMGICGNDFWLSIGCLLLFLIPAAIIGLVLRSPLQKFMTWYIGEVESSKLIT